MANGSVAPANEERARSGPLEAIVNEYLSAGHCDGLGHGAAMAALRTDVSFAEDEEVRRRTSRQLEQSFESLAEAMGGGREADAAAVTAWCAMVGAINLSRAFQGTDRSEQVLAFARQFILDLERRVQQAGSSDVRM